MKMIRFGPAGMGGAKQAALNLESYGKAGLKACEIAFTYGIYLKEETKEIDDIRKAALKNHIKLSIHAPYYINLNSKDRWKIETSKKRIIDCCRIGEKLGAYAVVFHPGFYGKRSKEESFEIIKSNVNDMIDQLKKERMKIRIAAETMGKVNVFGTMEDILRLRDETGCFFCVDFAHLKARSNGKMSYQEMYDQVKDMEELHCHFSGIVYGDKGEKHHILTPENEMKELLSALPRNKEIVVINESPDPVGDSLMALSLA